MCPPGRSIHRHGAPRVERSCLRSNQWRQNGESCSLGDPGCSPGQAPPSHLGTAVRASIFGRAELVWLTRHLHVRRGASLLGRGKRPQMPNAVRDSRVKVPQLPPRHITRTRLLAELDIAADLPLTLLSAGPGAGKTVLLTDWVRRSAARTAWLTPTPADAEPRRLWHLLESARREAHGDERGPPV